MSTLHTLAPAKVNLGLFLGPRRADGRHELVTVFESISLCDELTLTVLPEGQDEVSAPDVSGPNLVSAALEALRRGGWTGPPVRIEIAKRIPVAAGLGGGSSDAAAGIRLAHALKALPEGLAGRVALELGADVPSQLEPGVSIGTGAGEIVEPRQPLAPHAFVIVPQAYPLSTADVYREADRLGLPREELAGPERELRDATRPGATLPPRLLVNELEPAAVSLSPDIARALEAVRGAGADQALVCGSGPTVAGLWWGEESAQRVQAAREQLVPRYAGTSVATPVREAYPVRPAQFEPGP